jgi:hypothetical protein
VQVEPLCYSLECTITLQISTNSSSDGQAWICMRVIGAPWATHWHAHVVAAHWFGLQAQLRASRSACSVQPISFVFTIALRRLTSSA